jgi:hypothetical protein
VDLASNFKKLVGDVYYERDICLIPMLQRKIEQAIMVASSSMEYHTTNLRQSNKIISKFWR